MLIHIKNDLTKALCCMSSKDGEMCYMDFYNQKRKDAEPKMHCWDAEENGILCPFYQTKYNVEEQQKSVEHLAEVATLLELMAETAGETLKRPCS